MSADHSPYPPSPNTQQLFSLFTTLNDGESAPNYAEEEFVPSSIDPGVSFENLGLDHSDSELLGEELPSLEPWTGFEHSTGHPYTHDTRSLPSNETPGPLLLDQPQALQLDIPPPAEESQSSVLSSVLPPRQGPQKYKRQKNKSPVPMPYGQICFSVSGQPVQPSRRSAFAPDRRKEVNEVRKMKACLRCRVLRRACSGGDPCQRCLIDKQAATNSRVLMWMECVRPSLKDATIFKPVPFISDASSSAMAMKRGINVVGKYNLWVRQISDVAEDAMEQLAPCLCALDLSQSIRQVIERNFTSKLKLLFIVIEFPHSGMLKASDDENHVETFLMFRNYLADDILKELERKLRPGELQRSSPQGLQTLYVTLLLVYSATAFASYHQSMRQDFKGNVASENWVSREKAFLQLLGHYMTLIDEMYEKAMVSA